MMTIITCSFDGSENKKFNSPKDLYKFCESNKNKFKSAKGSVYAMGYITFKDVQDYAAELEKNVTKYIKSCKFEIELGD